MFKNWNINPTDYEFQEPNWFFSLILLPFLIYWIFYKEKRRFGDLKFNGSNEALQSFYNLGVKALRGVYIVLPATVSLLLIIALAKPYSWDLSEHKYEENKYGIDIVIALDVSLSMYAMDFSPNRLEAAKKVGIDFVNSRKGDKVGLVLYAGEAYTACPPTLDYPVLIDQLEQAEGMKLEQGTAIGTGLGTAVVQLRNEKLKSKVIILLTDGSNNWGDVSPQDAAMLAKQKNICVYTIGIGSNGMAPTPVITPVGIEYESMPVEIDEQTLTEIASITGGNYFRATDESALREIYKEIAKLEKRKITHKVIQSEPPATPYAFLNWAFVCALVFMGLRFLLFLPDAND